MNLNLGRKDNSENRIFFYAIFLGVAYLSFTVFRPLFSLLILALLISSIFQPVYRWLKTHIKRTSLALPGTMLAILLSLVIPFIIILLISIGQINVFIRDLSEFAGNSEEVQQILNTQNSYESEINTGDVETQVQATIDDINRRLVDLPFVEDEEIITLEEVQSAIGDIAESIARWVGNTALDIVANTPIFITNLIVFIIILSTLIPTQDKLKEYFLKVSPLDNKIDSLYLQKIEAMSNDMVKGTFVIAIVQGIICGILYWIAGVPYILFWSILCAFFSIIPNGGAIVNWPIVIALALSGNIVGSIIVLLGNLFIVTSSENILRPMLVSKKAYIHPSLTLIGIVGGLQVFGFLGFIYGPVIMILLATTIDIYVNHYKQN